jgi:hypothetical protein
MAAVEGVGEAASPPAGPPAEAAEPAPSQPPPPPPPPPPAPRCAAPVSWAAAARAAGPAPPPRPAPPPSARSASPASTSGAATPARPAPSAAATVATTTTAPLSPADAAALAPLLDPGLGSADDGGGPPSLPALAPRGLVNAGAACYMNAGLQALAATAAWRRFLAVAAGVGAPTLARLGAPTLAALAELGAALGAGGGGSGGKPPAPPPPPPGMDPAAAKAAARKAAKGGGGGGGAQQPQPQQQPPASTTTPALLLGGPPVDARAIMPSLDALKAAGLGGGAGGGPGPAPAAADDLPPLSAAAAPKKRGTAVRAVPLPRQEDAQEYLTHLLDAADCELARLGARVAAGRGGEKQQEEARGDDDDESGWVTAGRTRRAAAVTRGSGAPGPSTSTSASAFTTTTPIRAAFGGLLRSEVRTGGRAPPSATLQPFTLLSLDAGAPGVACVASALDALTRAEPIEGYRVAGSGESAAVRATKSLSLARPLPPALLLHLNRFVFDGTSGGGGKLRAPIAAPPTLRLKGSWLAAGTPPATYALVAVVAHHGPGLGSGHYTTAAALAPPDSRDSSTTKKWFIFDDADVSVARSPPWEGGFGGGGPGGDAYLVVYEKV